VIAERQPLARASGVSVVSSLAAGPVTFDADAELLGRAIGNVLDNAIVHTGDGGRVDVELKSYEGGRRFSLRIADTGPGVTDDEFAGLTANKRYRGDEARSRRAGGRGLGLALAREIADRHGLYLDLRRPETGGLEVEFALRRS
jgi:signal transduction histidine kinase